ncbi:MAG TPA: hypothetical protein VN578_11070 [Candidatus Binatia bacterium]|nr:hypothetical protein [Candidatus Binatia bacterium]
MNEICRRAAGKKRFHEDPNWAVQVLGRLVEKGVVESDSTGHYRLLRPEKKKEQKRWVSPQIRKILESSGKKFDESIDVEDDFPMD